MSRLVFAWIVIAASMTGCATAPTPAPAHEELPVERSMHQQGSLQIKAHHCDGGQGVDALLVHIDAPGDLMIRWDNRGVCGDPA